MSPFISLLIDSIAIAFLLTFRNETTCNGNAAGASRWSSVLLSLGAAFLGVGALWLTLHQVRGRSEPDTWVGTTCPLLSRVRFADGRNLNSFGSDSVSFIFYRPGCKSCHDYLNELRSDLAADRLLNGAERTVLVRVTDVAVGSPPEPAPWELATISVADFDGLPTPLTVHTRGGVVLWVSVRP